MRLKLRLHAVLLLLVAAGLVFVGQGVGLFLGAKTLSNAKSQLAAKEQQLTSLAHSKPMPAQARADALARELVELREAVGQAESLWRDNAISRALRDFAPPPNRRAAYFDLARYRQTLADLAREQGVEIGQDEFFGFRAYTNEGPEEADTLKVHTQRLVLERVLEPLLRSRPQRLLAVIREERGEPDLHNSEASQISTRFQIRFRGTTAVLRAWLNEVASAPLPILVRSVTVEPAVEQQITPVRGRSNNVLSSAPFAEADVEDGFELLVRPSGSEFLVTLDYVELGPAKRDEATSGEASRVSSASPKRLVTWPEPEPQRRGSQWVFEVFTPPEIFYHPARQQFYVKSVFPSAEPVLASNSLAESQRGGRTVPRLLSVRREDYLLQLSGYISGAAGEELFGIFENRESGETLLLRGGERVESLGIGVLDFRIETRHFADSENTALREPRAVATVRDAQGDQRTLREGERAKGHTLIAQIEWRGECVEVREGDVLVGEDGEHLVIQEIQSVPEPRVVMKSHTTATESDDSLAPLVLAVEPSPADSTH